MNIKVFLSQPMHGKTDEEIINTRNKLKAAAYIYYKDRYGTPHKNDVIFISTFDDEYNKNLTEKDLEGKNPRIYRLGHAIQRLSEADVVFFDDEYSLSNGCIVEMSTCVAYSLNYHKLSEFKDAIEFELFDKNSEISKLLEE